MKLENDQDSQQRSAPTIMCHGCGWTITLPFIGEGRVSIDAVEGWEISPDQQRVLCERCAGGWKPVIGDDDLWAEVQRRQLVVQIGYVNPKIHNQYERGAYVLFDQTWLDRWPVFGLRGGDSIAAVTPTGVADVGKS